jgi:hypothetical protein
VPAQHGLPLAWRRHVAAQVRPAAKLFTELVFGVVVGVVFGVTAALLANDRDGPPIPPRLSVGDVLLAVDLLDR